MRKSLVITGATATGKTRLGVQLAARFGGEIVSADSRQVYMGLDIGTGKDLAEYSQCGQPVPFHMIDIVRPTEDFHLFRYLEMVKPALEGIFSRGKLPVVVGGSPLYVKAMLDGYDCDGGAPDEELRSELAEKPLPELIEIFRKEAPEPLFRRTDLTQCRRVIRGIEIARHGRLSESQPLLESPLILMPAYPRAEIHRRIERRLDERLKEGMLDEARALHEAGLSWEKMEWLGLEYRFCARHLSGTLSFQEMRDTLLAHIRQFCKRQEGWFRKFEREGKVIHRISEGNLDEATRLVEEYLAGGRGEAAR